MLVVILSLREAVMSFPLVRKWKFWIRLKLKKSFADIARLYGKNESFIRDVTKNKEKIRASFSVALQTAKVTAIARDKVLMKVEKALNFWMENMIFIAYAALWWKSMIFIVLSSLETVHDTARTGTVFFHCSIVSWGLG